MIKELWKKKWAKVVVILIVLSVLGKLFGFYEDEPIPKEKKAVADVEPTLVIVENTQIDTSDKEEIAKDVDNLIDSNLKGDAYFCQLSTLTDGSGYIVSVQLPANKEKPESTKIIERILQNIKNLKNDRIREIYVTALKQMKIVDECRWSIDEQNND